MSEKCCAAWLPGNATSTWLGLASGLSAAGAVRYRLRDGKQPAESLDDGAISDEAHVASGECLIDGVAELGAHTALVDDLARAICAGDWHTAYAISDRLSVDVSVAA